MAIDHAAPAVDESAFGRLFDEWLDPIYGFVARRVEDREAAEDVTTRTFHRAAEVLRDRDLPVDQLPGILLRIAGSAVLDHARRMRRDLPANVRASDLDQEGDAEAAAWLADASASRAFAAAVDGIALRRAILRLDDADLRMILLRYLDGLDLDGVAAVVGCSRDDAAARARAALAALQAELPRAEAHVA